jgi:hypothetical protein
MIFKLEDMQNHDYLSDLTMFLQAGDGAVAHALFSPYYIPFQGLLYNGSTGMIAVWNTDHCVTRLRGCIHDPFDGNARCQSKHPDGT